MRIAVIGGGIIGVSIALKALKKGFKVTLFEKGKLLASNSAYSSKLIHGGIRYLENLEFNFVRKSLKDRHYWLSNYGEFVRPIEKIFLIKEGFGRPSSHLYFGAKLYELLAGKYSVGKTSFLNKDSIQKKIDNLSEHINSGVSYWDCYMEDKELSKQLVKDLEDLDCDIRENCLINKVKKSGEVEHAQQIDKFKYVVNCTGPWVNNILDSKSKYEIIPVKGSHLVLNQKINNGFVLQNNDGRILFQIPFRDHSIFGTTEIECSLTQAPEITKEETTYLKDVYNVYFKNMPEIIGSYSGIRPIVKTRNFSIKLSREDKIEKAGSLINIYGGKWTSAPSIADELFKRYV